MQLSKVHKEAKWADFKLKLVKNLKLEIEAITEQKVLVRQLKEPQQINNITEISFSPQPQQPQQSHKQQPERECW